MAITAPTPITAAPPVPDSGQPEPTFDAQYEAFNTWERQQLVPGANALAANVYANAQAAEAAKAGTDGGVAAASGYADSAKGYRDQASTAASTATTQAGNASTSAGQAEASRIEASKLNLGAKSAAPTVDNQGQALRVGATYYDTTLNKLRAWSGTAWADPVNVTAGVKSLNNESGDLVKTTLAGYGIQDFKIAITGDADLNTLLTPGKFRFFGSAPNSPPGVIHSVLDVSRVEDTGSHVVVDYLTGLIFSRGFAIQGDGSVFWTPWRFASSDNAPWVDLGSANTIDLRLGRNFKLAMSANRTLAIDFFGQAGRSFFLELTLTGGALLFSSPVIWPKNTAPSFATSRRHLLFFQLASNVNAWYASVLPEYVL